MKQLDIFDAMQMTLFDFLQAEPKQEKQFHKLNVGDRIHRRVLGEIRSATITEVVGNANYYFYRTDSGGCYQANEENNSLEQLQKEAVQYDSECITMTPHDLEQRVTVQYPPRKSDGKILWAQIGIYGDMLYWKEECTYQFLEPFKSKKELMKAYNEHLAKITAHEHTVLEEEHKMERLYWSEKSQCFATAEYQQWRIGINNYK